MERLRKSELLQAEGTDKKAAQTQSDRILLITQDDGPRRKGKSLAEA